MAQEITFDVFLETFDIAPRAITWVACMERRLPVADLNGN